MDEECVTIPSVPRLTIFHYTIISGGSSTVGNNPARPPQDGLITGFPRVKYGLAPSIVLALDLKLTEQQCVHIKGKVQLRDRWVTIL